MEDLLANLSKINDQISSYDPSTGDSLNALFLSCHDILEGALVEWRRSASRSNEQTKPAMTKIFASLMKTLRLRKRKSEAMHVSEVEKLMKEVEDITKEMNSDGSTQIKSKDSWAATAASATPGLPTSVQEYQSRLVQHGKELYKHPPALPPPVVVIAEQVEVPPPQRDPVTRRLSFFMPFEDCVSSKSGGGKRKSKSTAVVVADFHPNVTPDEVLLGGAFGGTYFRDIHSAVTNIRYSGNDVLASTLPSTWLEQFTPKSRSTLLTSSVYRTTVNKFKVKCGGSLGMWESSGWISDADPYGWFQWYCRFYCGRRSSDDARQIARWKSLAGPKGRFKSQLCNKILQQATAVMGTPIKSNKEQLRNAVSIAVNDVTISPVIRQTLFHWGLLITDEVIEQHQRSK